MKLQLLLYFALIATCSIYSQSGGGYPVSDINQSLLVDADAVIREDIQTWEMLGSDKANFEHKLVITIMSTKGLVFADLHVFHDSFSKIKNVSGVLYDSQGNKIRTLKKNEFEDAHIQDGFSVFSDSRRLSTDLYFNQYPFTVEFNYTIEKSVLYPNMLWMPVSKTGVSLQKASFNCIVPENFKFRYKQNYGIKAEPEIISSGRNKLLYKWELNNLPSWSNEPFMSFPADVFPSLLIGPELFEFAGYSGSMKTWNDFGNWINSLNHGRQALDDNTRLLVKRILSDNPNDTLEIIREIYEYVQRNTRYVSIQLGIGGFQPFDASFVAENKYGDCKALANFTQSLLAEAGIRSHYTLIRSGDGPVDVDPQFPFNYFNHAILCVPLANDTLWLETTANIFPMGFIGESNSDRWALVITPTGGQLVRTPALDQQKNNVDTNLFLSIDQQMNIQGSSSKRLEGLAMDDLMGISLIGKEKQSDYITRKVTINNFELVDFAYTEEMKGNPNIEEDITFSINNYFQKAGDRYIFQPLLMAHCPQIKSNSRDRTIDFRLRFYKVYRDTIVWQMPPNYHPLSLPENYKSDTHYGYYSIDYEYDATANTLILIRCFYGKRGVFAPQHWSEFYEFMKQIKIHDQLQMMLVRQTE